MRWEVFAHGYPQDRWDAHWEAITPPTVGDGSRTEVLTAEARLTAEFPGYPRRCLLVVKLANIPDRARGPWGNWLAQALVDAAHELDTDFRFDQLALYQTGQLSLRCQPGYDAVVVASVIRRGVELTDERYRSWIDDRNRRVERLRVLRDEFDAVVRGARSGPLAFGQVAVTERSIDGKAVVSLALNLSEAAMQELLLCTDVFRDAGGVLAGTGHERNRLVFDAFELTDANAGLLREAIQRCESILIEKRAHLAREVRDFQDFAKRIGELGVTP